MTESKTAFQAFASLLSHAASGDQNAQQELIKRIHPQVFSFAKEHTSTLKDANDLSAQIEREMIHALNELDSVKRFYPWLKEIENSVLTTKTVGYFVSESQQDQLIANIIQQLTEDQKTVFQLYYGQKESISDISVRMHLDEDVVTGILEQAKKKISDSVIQMEKKEGLKTYDLAPIPLILYMLFHYTKTEAIAAGDNYTAVAMASETYEPSRIPMNQGSNIAPKETGIAESSMRNANQDVTVENRASNTVRNTQNTVVKKASRHIAAKVAGGVLAGAVALDAGSYAYYRVTTDDQSKKDFVTWNASLITNITNDQTLISSPENTIEDLENAFNERDLNALIACFDPDFQSYYKSFVEFGDALSGEDTDAVYSMLFSAMTGESGLMPQTIDLDVISTEENGNTAVCKIQIIAHFASIDDIRYEETVDMIQEDDEWYIDSGVSSTIE